MSRLGIFIADGCEEVEALTVVDIVRRAKLEIDMISINGTKQVTSSRNVTFMTDTTKEEADFSAYDGIILPVPSSCLRYRRASPSPSASCRRSCEIAALRPCMR